MRNLLLIASLLISAAIHAETTPLTEPLTEESDITIACELTQPPPHNIAPIFDDLKDVDACKGTYHYKLWLPKGYLSDTTKHWSCMFVMSASGNEGMGNASMKPMADYLKAHDFIVVGLTESRNGPWPPVIGNFLAAHDDVIKRVRIAEGQKFATGASGGARGSSVFVQARPGFCGLVLQAAGPASDSKSHRYHVAEINRNSKLYVAMTMGRSDTNYPEIVRTKPAIQAARFHVFEFDGGHGWAPPEIFAQAMDWIAQKTSGKSPSSSLLPH